MRRSKWRAEVEGAGKVELFFWYRCTIAPTKTLHGRRARVVVSRAQSEEQRDAKVRAWVKRVHSRTCKPIGMSCGWEYTS